MHETRQSIIAKLRESVCKVICYVHGEQVGVGTGFFVADDGILLTCNHVISYFELDEHGNIVPRYFPEISVQTPRGVFPAKIIHDKSSTHPLFEDYAVLKTDIKVAAPFHLGDYDAVEPGDDILILGFPFGFKNVCATSGMVSAKHRSPCPFNNLINLDMLRIDGSVNKGNSGGPLIDIKTSSVVGIVSLRIGSIEKEIEQLKFRDSFPRELLEILELINKYLNVGIGEAISISYAFNELKQLGIKQI